MSDYGSALWRAVHECFPAGRETRRLLFSLGASCLAALCYDAGMQNAFQSDAKVTSNPCRPNGHLKNLSPKRL